MPARPNAPRTILVTGFGAFPGAPRNPTEAIVAALQKQRGRLARLGIDLRCVTLPVHFAAIEPQLLALAKAHRPDAILHLGLAGRRRCISVETRAINRAGPLHPDASGRRPAQVLLPGAPSILPATHPGRRITAALRAAGLDAAPSIDAGDYVCNATLFRSLAMELAPEIGFLHVPRPRRRMPSRAGNGRLRPTQDDLTRAALLAVLAMVRRPLQKR